MENWRQIENTNYSVSNFGNVKNNKSGKILKPEKTKKGYLRVEIGGKHKRIHRLVASAFFPNPENFPCVDHKDRNRQNNNYDNLRWCSYATNNLNRGFN